jgi:hypothetical protein
MAMEKEMYDEFPDLMKEMGKIVNDENLHCY